AINELQLERRGSLRYLMDANSKQTLLEQRAKTDRSMDTIQRVAEQKEQYAFNFPLGLSTWRQQIDEYTLTPEQTVQYYQMLMDRLRSISYIQSDNPTILAATGDSLRAVFLLSDMINRLSLMRLEIYLVNLDEKLLQSDYLRDFSTNYDLYQSFEQEFISLKDTALIANYTNLAQKGPLHTTLNYIDSIAKTGPQQKLDPENWWETSAAGMDQIRIQHDALMSHVHTIVASIYKAEVKD